MAIAFVVETGAASASSTAYITVAFFRDFCEVEELDLTDVTDTEAERAIMRATRYMDTRYFFRGFRSSELQNLEWPRFRAHYDDGRIALNVPKEVMEACAFLAHRATSTRLAPDPVYDSSGARVLSKTDRVGPIEESREFAGGGALARFRAYPEADQRLRELTYSGTELLRA